MHCVSQCGWLRTIRSAFRVRLCAWTQGPSHPQTKQSCRQAQVQEPIAQSIDEKTVPKCVNARLPTKSKSGFSSCPSVSARKARNKQCSNQCAT